MQKIFCLPKISIKQMQSKVRQQRVTHKKYNYEQNCAEKDHSHHQGIKITSPFYERMHHKEKCECRYHKLKREMQANRRIYGKKQATIYEEGCRGIELNQSIEKDRFLEITKRVSNIQLGSPYKVLSPLQNTVSMKTEIDNQTYEDLDTNAMESHSKSIKKLPTRKTFKSIKYKPIMQTLDETVNCRIDALNQQFIELISKRFQNQKFKQKYIKTLFGFIKMKSNQNKKYMQRSKAYIHNSLNMLLNHYSLEKLLDFSKLREEQINQIGYYMNCFPDKVKGILYDLGRAVSQMERLLSQMKQRRNMGNGDKQNEPTIFINNYDQMQNTMDHNRNSENNQGINSLQEYNYKNALTKDTYLSSIDQNNTSFVNIGSNSQLNKINENDSNLLKSNQSEKHNILRSSSRKINDLISKSSSKKDMQNKDSANNQSNIRKSIRLSQKNNQMFNRSLRSTVLGLVDQIQKEANFAKKKITTKLKKGKLKSKQSQFDQKYSNIQYQRYLTKKHFHNLISQVERLDQNDVERGQTIFKELGVEGFLDDHEKIQDLVKTFKPLFNEKSLHYFLRQIVMVRDKRYIQKLERQLDDMLNQIKKNDPRGQVMDFFQIKPEKKVPSYMNKMTKCREFKVQKEESINHIKYFEAQQQIQRHRTKEQSVKMHLEQVPLMGIRFDTIDQAKSKIITHSLSPKRQYESSKTTSNLPDLQDQKKILRYMKQKHEGTFNYLASEFDALCKSLVKQNL